MARVLFYVQHLLGIGHVIRAARICRELGNAGYEIRLIMGGVPIPHLTFHDLEVVQLPPLKAAAGAFTHLLMENGRSATGEYRKLRAKALMEVFDKSDPDIVLIETFPFGRRQMQFELLPLLETAHERKPRPVIISSVRDILQESNRLDRSRETAALLRRYFDKVVVHGDPGFISLGATFPLAREIENLISYSGLVAPRVQAQPSASVADVVVSAGGGAVGCKLVETAIAAKSRTALAKARWLILTGPNVDPRWFSRVAARAANGDIAVERFVPDLASVLAGARLSISQAGYNTVADILVAGCRAVFIPFSDSGETEQTRRAALLEANGFGVALSEQSLSPSSLASAVDRALDLPPPRLCINLEGAAETTKILARLRPPAH